MHVAVVGLGFGHGFVPIYQAHPFVKKVTICDASAEVVARTAQEFHPSGATTRFEDVLADPTIDAVHLLTPLPLHFEHTLSVIEAGKHCACAVTMGSTLKEIEQIVEAVQRAGKVYMMMETGAFTREFFFARDMVQRDDLGPISFLRADYFQDLEAGYPTYWRLVPPMHYATHALGPMLALTKTRVQKVSCLGGGKLRSDISDDPANPFPMQSALFRLQGHDAVAQVNRAWYQTAREYVESFSVYGAKRGFEWQQLEREDPVVFTFGPVDMSGRWRDCHGERVAVPFRPDLLPEELADFANGGHGGSHPHLVHEFLSAIVEGRKSSVNEVISAEWCAAGICAHESSLRDGEWIAVPSFS